ncbi:amino acid permease [Legionella hackeliae]|uniref:Arginine/agmatine antiporter n=1 Tax=Legionella hackeliae TaxID=449 RepID=A0A0A8UT39_LEGHA|nr:amino acid permease [Legionella hackeliae]KTD13942.1 amino acid permease family protein [Legionella hackeliae]CEK10646.1 Amino acid permease family protein [Legionella hackeliae]STX47391.1 amino acid permease family protein [Legionella hackeliae]
MEQRRILGLPASTSLVIGNMVGSGIFLLPSSLASFGSISLLGWVITALGSILLAIIFGKLSQRLPLVGGLYAYCRHQLGDFAGYQVSVAYLLGNIIGDAATVVALLAYLTIFWPAINTNHPLAFFVGSIIIWGIALLNVIGIKEVKIVQVTTTIIKLVPIVLVSIVGLFHVQIANLSDFNISGQSNITALANVVMLTFFAFAGLESATIPAESVKNPEKTIYRATVLGTIITALIYLLSTVAIMGMFSSKFLANNPAPFAAAGQVIFGHLTNQIFALAAIIACLCTIIGFLFITSQTAMATARDGLLPGFLAKLSRFHTPYWSIIISSLIMTILLGMNYSKLLTSQFTLLVTLSNLCILVPYLYTTVAAILSFRQFNKGDFIKMVVIFVLACIYVLFAIIGSGQEVIFYGIVLLFILTPFYSLIPASFRESKLDKK